MGHEPEDSPPSAAGAGGTVTSASSGAAPRDSGILGAAPRDAPSTHRTSRAVVKIRTTADASRRFSSFVWGEDVPEGDSDDDEDSESDGDDAAVELPPVSRRVRCFQPPELDDPGSDGEGGGRGTGEAADAANAGAAGDSSASGAGSKMCTSCGIKPARATFVHGHTGHTVNCLACAHAHYAKSSRCPVCRQEITQVIEVFLA